MGEQRNGQAPAGEKAACCGESSSGAASALASGVPASGAPAAGAPAAGAPAPGVPAAWLDEIRWDADGLVPAIAQEAATGDILMVAWMNREALLETAATGRAVYWSRSRKRLWRKGEESGHVQQLHELRLDCDGDVVLLKVEQLGGIACHTGRHSCFFRRLENGGWAVVDPVLKDPESIYK